MGSLFYNERTPKREEFTPKVEDYGKALEKLAQRRPETEPAAILGGFDRSAELRRVVEKVEPQLIEAVAADRVKNTAEALSFVRDLVPAWFPVEKFVQIVVTNGGGTAAAFIQACKDEVGAGGVGMSAGEVRGGSGK